MRVTPGSKFHAREVLGGGVCVSRVWRDESRDDCPLLLVMEMYKGQGLYRISWMGVFYRIEMSRLRFG